MSAVYLDYNASGLVRPEVLEIMTKALADNGNPSAVHAAGRRARARITGCQSSTSPSRAPSLCRPMFRYRSRRRP